MLDQRTMFFFSNRLCALHFEHGRLVLRLLCFPFLFVCTVSFHAKKKGSQLNHLWWNKSDTSYLKTRRPSNIPIHSRVLLEAILSQLETLHASQVRSCSLLAFSLLVSLTSLSLRCLCFSESGTCNCARLLTVATPVLKVKLHGNNIPDIIITHVISGDTQTNPPPLDEWVRTGRTDYEMGGNEGRPAIQEVGEWGVGL